MDRSRNFFVELGEGAVDGSEVGSKLVAAKVKPDLEHEPIDLRIELHSEKGHWGGL